MITYFINDRIEFLFFSNMSKKIWTHFIYDASFSPSTHRFEGLWFCYRCR